MINTYSFIWSFVLHNIQFFSFRFFGKVVFWSPCSKKIDLWRGVNVAVKIDPLTFRRGLMSWVCVFVDSLTLRRGLVSLTRFLVTFLSFKKGLCLKRSILLFDLLPFLGRLTFFRAHKLAHANISQNISCHLL